MQYTMFAHDTARYAARERNVAPFPYYEEAGQRHQTGKARTEVRAILKQHAADNLAEKLLTVLDEGRLVGDAYHVSGSPRTDSEFLGCFWGHVAHIIGSPDPITTKRHLIDAILKRHITDSSVEQLVWHVNPGETPETNEALALLKSWIQEYQSEKG